VRLREVEAPSPAELRGGWAVLAALHAANDYGDLVYATNDEWFYSDAGGNWACVRFRGDGKALLLGHDHEYSETVLREDSPNSALLKNAPAWWSETAFPIIYGDMVGFVYGWENETWQRAVYNTEDGFHYVGLLDATRVRGRHSLSDKASYLVGPTDDVHLEELVKADADITIDLLSKVTTKNVDEAVQAARNFLLAPSGTK